MYRPTPRRTPLLLATICSLSLFATACGDSSASGTSGAANAVKGDASPNAPTRKGLTVAFLPKQVGTPYFKVADEGGRRAVTELGSTFEETGPERGADTAGQVSYINAATQDEVDAMAVSALDPEALCTALKKALDAGLKVVTYDSDTRPECRNAFVAPAGAEDIAVSQLELLGKQIGYRGEFAILSAARTATNQNAWIASIKKALSDPRYKDMELVDIAYGDDDAKKSYEQAQALLESHPGLAGIISPTTNGIKAAAEYLSRSEFKGTVRLTGLGAPNDMRSYVKDGTVEAFLLWDPARLGELAGHAAVALASGQITGREGQMFLAGDMGWFEVGEDGVITLGEPTQFNAKNIDDYDF
ncbi:rhamnose ABC transporter substrate-binding protein [Streptomyces sp. NPDC003719]